MQNIRGSVPPEDQISIKHYHRDDIACKINKNNLKFIRFGIPRSIEDGDVESPSTRSHSGIYVITKSTFGLASKHHESEMCDL